MGELKTILSELKTLRRKPDGDVYTSDLDIIARPYRKNHDLALSLWGNGSLAARLLATRIIDQEKITEDLLEEWLPDLNEWGLCDGFCASVVRPTKWAVAKCHEWAAHEPEFERRAAFATMAQLAWQKNGHPDSVFLTFLPLIEQFAHDDRLYVKKAVNWALRDIGKRNASLQPYVLAVAERLQNSGDKTVRWVGRHRIKEVLHAF